MLSRLYHLMYILHPKSMKNQCDFMMPCALHIYTAYSTEFFFFSLLCMLYNLRHLATLHRYSEANYISTRVQRVQIPSIDGICQAHESQMKFSICIS